MQLMKSSLTAAATGASLVIVGTALAYPVISNPSEPRTQATTLAEPRDDYAEHDCDPNDNGGNEGYFGLLAQDTSKDCDHHRDDNDAD